MKLTEILLIEVAGLLFYNQTSPTLAFSYAPMRRAPFLGCRRGQAREVEKVLRGRSGEEENNEAKRDIGTSDVISKVIDFLSNPTPGIADLALGFPLALLLLATLVPLPQVILTIALFAALRTAAVRLVVFEETSDEDPYGIEALMNGSKHSKDEPLSSLAWRIDAATIFLAIFAAGLLVPDGDVSSEIFTWAMLPGMALVVAISIVAWNLFNTVVEIVVSDEQLTLQDKLLNKWDQKFQHEATSEDEKEKE